MSIGLLKEVVIVEVVVVTFLPESWKLEYGGVCFKLMPEPGGGEGD